MITPLACALAAVKSYDVVSISKHDVEVYIEEQGDATLVSFRGTESDGWGMVWDVIRDVRIFPLWDRELGFCHAGFRWGVRVIWPQLEPILQDAKRRGRRIYFAGHSLGGSMATGASVYCNALVKRPSGLVTLGAPSIGGRRVGRALRAYPVWRFVNGADVIPKTVLFPHHASALAGGPRRGRFEDHKGAHYLELVDGWPGSHELF